MSIYDEWNQAAYDLKEAKKRELELRNEICESILKDKFEGAVTVIDEGFKITATAKLTRSVDTTILETIWDELDDAEKECIKYKPSLVASEFKRLENRGQGNKLFEAITVKPAQATLAIKPLATDDD